VAKVGFLKGAAMKYQAVAYLANKHGRSDDAVANSRLMESVSAALTDVADSIQPVLNLAQEQTGNPGDLFAVIEIKTNNTKEN